MAMSFNQENKALGLFIINLLGAIFCMALSYFLIDFEKLSWAGIPLAFAFEKCWFLILPIITIAIYGLQKSRLMCQYPENSVYRAGGYGPELLFIILCIFGIAFLALYAGNFLILLLNSGVLATWSILFSPLLAKVMMAGRDESTPKNSL
jgi:hypothetical protein